MFTNGKLPPLFDKLCSFLLSEEILKLHDEVAEGVVHFIHICQRTYRK